MVLAVTVAEVASLEHAIPCCTTVVVVVLVTVALEGDVVEDCWNQASSSMVMVTLLLT